MPLQSPEGQSKVGLEALKDFIESNVKFGEIGTKDESLAVNSVVLGEREGYLRFVHFPNDVMEKFLLLAKEFNASAVNTTMGATGGGAFKFEGKFQEVCNINQHFSLDCSYRPFFRMGGRLDFPCPLGSGLRSSPKRGEERGLISRNGGW